MDKRGNIVKETKNYKMLDEKQRFVVIRNHRFDVMDIRTMKYKKYSGRIFNILPRSSGKLLKNTRGNYEQIKYEVPPIRDKTS